MMGKLGFFYGCGAAVLLPFSNSGSLASALTIEPVFPKACQAFRPSLSTNCQNYLGDFLSHAYDFQHQYVTRQDLSSFDVTFFILRFARFLNLVKFESIIPLEIESGEDDVDYFYCQNLKEAETILSHLMSKMKSPEQTNVMSRGQVVGPLLAHPIWDEFYVLLRYSGCEIFFTDEFESSN